MRSSYAFSCILYLDLCHARRDGSPHTALLVNKWVFSGSVMTRSPVPNATVYRRNFPSRCFCAFRNFPIFCLALSQLARRGAALAAEKKSKKNNQHDTLCEWHTDSLSQLVDVKTTIKKKVVWKVSLFLLFFFAQWVTTHRPCFPADPCDADLTTSCY